MVIRVGNVQKSILFGCSEIILQDREALLAENTAENLGFPAGALKYDLGRATTFFTKNAFQFLTAGAVDQTTEFGPYHGSTAHKARLTTCIQSVCPQISDAGLTTKFSNQTGLSVEGGVVSGVDLIFVGKDDLTIFYKDSAEGFISMGNGCLGKSERFFHKDLVIHDWISYRFGKCVVVKSIAGRKENVNKRRKSPERVLSGLYCCRLCGISSRTLPCGSLRLLL